MKSFQKINHRINLTWDANVGGEGREEKKLSPSGAGLSSISGSLPTGWGQDGSSASPCFINTGCSSVCSWHSYLFTYIHVANNCKMRLHLIFIYLQSILLSQEYKNFWGKIIYFLPTHKFLERLILYLIGEHFIVFKF